MDHEQYTNNTAYFPPVQYFTKINNVPRYGLNNTKAMVNKAIGIGVTS